MAESRAVHRGNKTYAPRERNIFGEVKQDETGQQIAVQRSQSGQQTGTATQKLSWWGRLKRDIAGHPIEHRDKKK